MLKKQKKYFAYLYVFHILLLIFRAEEESKMPDSSADDFLHRPAPQVRIAGQDSPNLGHNWSHRPNRLKMDTHFKEGILKLT